MAAITVLADDVTQIVDALESVDAEFTAAARSLRDLTPEDVGPPDVADAVTEVVTRLERRLGGLATMAGDGARAMRRHISDLPATESGPAAGPGSAAGPGLAAEDEP
jgi:hypothetical protein